MRSANTPHALPSTAARSPAVERLNEALDGRAPGLLEEVTAASTWYNPDPALDLAGTLVALVAVRL